MPFIHVRTTKPVEKKTEKELAARIGNMMPLIGKSEQWLMLGFEQNCSLYFRGEKSEKIAYVEVSLYGTPSASACDKLTAEICRIYGEVLGIPADRIYVKYSPTDMWGWNGGNF